LNNSVLEIWVTGHSRSLKIPFKSFGTVSYLHSIVTIWPYLVLFRR